MGAIFVAAGLLIGLISVISLLSLEDRVNSAYRRAHEELRPLFEDQANKQIEAHIGFLQAAQAGDWETAEKLTSEALQQYPKLRGARAFLGARLAQTAIVHFKIGCSPWVAIADHAGGLMRMRWAARDLPITEAVQWLEDALKHDENQNNEVALNLVLMHGLNGKTGKMLAALRAIPEEARPALLDADSLLCLANGCALDPSLLPTVGHLLATTLPVPSSTLHEWLESLNIESMPQVLDVWAIDMPGSWWPTGAPRWPAQLRFRVSKDAQGMRVAQLTWFPEHPAREMGTYEPVSMPSDGKTAAVSSVVDEACKRFSIIGPCASVGRTQVGN